MPIGIAKGIVKTTDTWVLLPNILLQLVRNSLVTGIFKYIPDNLMHSSTLESLLRLRM
jgi:hypothetical protein